MLEEKVNCRDLVLLEGPKQRHLAVPVLMVHVRTCFDERTSKIDFGCLASDGVCQGGHPNDVFDVHGEATGYEVFEGFLVLEVAGRIGDKALSTSNKEGSIAKFEWCFCEVQIRRCSRCKSLGNWYVFTDSCI